MAHSVVLNSHCILESGGAGYKHLPSSIDQLNQNPWGWLRYFFFKPYGFPGGMVVKNPPVNAGDRGCGFDSWVRKIP